MWWTIYIVSIISANILSFLCNYARSKEGGNWYYDSIEQVSWRYVDTYKQNLRWICFGLEIVFLLLSGFSLYNVVKGGP